MPKAAKKKPVPVVPVPPAPPPEPEVVVALAPAVGEDGQPLKMMYPTIEMTLRCVGSEFGPLDVAYAKDALGWETEAQYKARKCAEEPGSKPDQWIYGEVFHCRNASGEKVRCTNNGNNRYLDETWCEALVHTILHGRWAGPHTIQNGTVNGETVRISQYGRVISGQHQMTALILANEWLAKARANGTDNAGNPKYPAWKAHPEPFIECITIKGISEDPRVLMTIDYVKPRTVADVFYTSPLFKEATSTERKELCKMLASAVELLWTRTHALGYRTHPEVVAFLERHKRTLKCVEHLYKESNNERQLNKLGLNAGQCAGLMYLMGCSGTSGEDSDVYRNQEPPTEKGLDWGFWEKAEEFWTLLAAGRDFMPVRTALGALRDSKIDSDTNQGQGGRAPEKLALLAKAWERWREHAGSGAPFDANDLAPGGTLCLAYSDLDDTGKKLPDKQIKLLDVADFYGIDCPDAMTKKAATKAVAEPPELTREEIQKAIDEAAARKRAGK